ncbi:MAG TPA: DUF2127 domain-containing protein [Tepidisphaeraceae bacterium]|nr:DUF2127 domain-containing protein [Tepidisphaeraceae bacterium]
MFHSAFSIQNSEFSIALISRYNARAMAPSQVDSSRTLFVIAIYKLLHGTAFVLLAMAVHHLVITGDVAATVTSWVRQIKLDPQNRHIHAVIEKLTGVNPRRLRELSIGTLVYASLFYIEGIGLLFRRRWAEYMVVVTTGVFLPLEIYEVAQRHTPLRIAVLLANAAIVVYLIYRLWKTRPEKNKCATPAPETS